MQKWKGFWIWYCVQAGWLPTTLWARNSMLRDQLLWKRLVRLLSYVRRLWFIKRERLLRYLLWFLQKTRWIKNLLCAYSSNYYATLIKTVQCTCISIFCSTDTCVDGIQNQGEDGTDCGGPCPTCGKLVIPLDR